MGPRSAIHWNRARLEGLGEERTVLAAAGAMTGGAGEGVRVGAGGSAGGPGAAVACAGLELIAQ